MSTRYEMGPCPACGSGEADEIASRDDVLRELEQLWAFHTRRMRGDTPPELLQDRVAFSQEPALRIVRCRGCGLLYRNPREDPEQLVELYGDEAPDTETLSGLFDTQLSAARAQARRFARVGGRSGRGLEVGSYVGTFLAAVADEGWTFAGVDVNEAACTFARDRGLDVSVGTVEDVQGDGSYDAVAFWNCFDQLPDPVAAARAARRLLRTGGWLVVRVPSGAFYERWRSRLHWPLRYLARALLVHNNLLAFPYRHGFSVAALQALLERCDFDVIHMAGDTLVPIADRWTRSWARAEERLIKTALRPVPAARAAWLEVYARAR